VTREDAGFTLVELLIAVAILGVLGVAFGELGFIGFKTTAQATTLFAGSHDAQIAQTFWQQDAQDAATVDSVASDTRCVQTGDTLVVRFTGQDTDASAAVTTHVETYVQRVSGTETQLIRRACSGPYGGTLSDVGDVVVLHELGDPATLPAPVAPSLTCTPTCTSPRIVTLSVTEQTGYRFALAGRRRPS
jgi:prepilin-type N-terminal cleavage/methylation domain-containing protein